MAKFHYWTGGAVFTTTNSQMPIGSQVTLQLLANRSSSDTLMRVVCWAEASLRSTGSNTGIEGWWSAASVRLVLTFDGAGTQDPLDIDADDPRILGFADLQPRYAATQTAGHSVTQFESPPQGLDVRGRRKGAGGEIVPGLLATLFYYDQNGVWAGSGESAAERRARISCRVLWDSDEPPP
jgi:hypothetical protein